MTEEEAEKLLCPFAKTFDAMGNIGEYIRPTCVAADCMSWRWTKIANPDWKPENVMTSTFPRPNPYSATPPYILSTTDGRCGLAGQ